MIFVFEGLKKSREIIFIVKIKINLIFFSITLIIKSKP
jgi:predicted methyltransferase MtxX (methanogen marker protein 4)